MDLPRFRGHRGYGALHWGSEGMSRSIRNVRTSRRKRPNSSRSSVVRLPAGPRPRPPPAIPSPLPRPSRTVWVLNPSVNARRFRLAMEHSYRTFVRSAVSTKPGQVQSYIGYFANRSGEQWIFTRDRATDAASLRGGDVD